MKIYLVTIRDAHLGNIRKWAGSLREAKRIVRQAKDEYDLLNDDGCDIKRIEFPTKRAEVIAWLDVHAGFDND